MTWPDASTTRAPLTTALIDVGGTLWPDGWPWAPDDHEIRSGRLRQALPGLDMEAAPAACAMVGNSESKDVVPAKRLGLRTIRVAIEEPKPPTSQADAVTNSLEEVAHLLLTWSTESEGL